VATGEYSVFCSGRNSRYTLRGRIGEYWQYSLDQAQKSELARPIFGTVLHQRGLARFLQTHVGSESSLALNASAAPLLSIFESLLIHTFEIEHPANEPDDALPELLAAPGGVVQLRDEFLLTFLFDFFYWP
jgi:hypothetical protein